MSDRRNTRAAIALYQRAHSFQPLSDWVVAAGEDIYRKILSHLPDLSCIGKPRERVQEGLHRRSRERREAEWIVDEGIHFRVIPAKPIDRRARWLKRSIHRLHRIASCRDGLSNARQAIQSAGPGKH